MKRQHDACVAYFNTNISRDSLRFIFASLGLISLFSINVNSLSAFVLYMYATEMSIRMLANIYKCFKITTNVLPSIRKACNCDAANMLSLRILGTCF